MDGIFSKSLFELKNSNNNLKNLISKEKIETLIKKEYESSFSEYYHDIYKLLKNPHENFFSKTLLNEINYMNIKGGDFFGAFLQPEEKLNHYLKSNPEKKNNANYLNFNLPTLKDKNQINTFNNSEFKKNFENEYEKYLITFPEINPNSNSTYK